MFIEDLSTRCLFPDTPYSRAIGWLEHDHPFPVGPVPQEFLARLRKHLTSAYQVTFSPGGHPCSLCPSDPPYGSGHLLIPTAKLLYIAPTLLHHYVVHHHYRPPEEFIWALISCPRQGSPSYLELLARLGFNPRLIFARRPEQNPNTPWWKFW
jgi:hypothetical protein